jgi:hypothetical protein
VKLIHVAELVVECFGIERVDPSWISSLYLADVPSVKDHRRVSRKIFSCEPIKLLSSQHLLPGHLAEYAVRWAVQQLYPCSAQPYSTSPATQGEPQMLNSSSHGACLTRTAGCCHRVKLPAQLPPTFRGSSIRFSYHFQARAEYTCEGGHGFALKRGCWAVSVVVASYRTPAMLC